LYNVEEMVRNVKRHGDNDQYSNGKLAKYKKMIKDFKNSFYHGCAAQCTRLFVMVKLFQLKASNGWSNSSFKDSLMLLKEMLPQANTFPTFFNISVHFTTHLIKEIELFDLVFLHQMYAYERYNGILKSFIRN
jgi:hypothetical protein